MSSLRRTITTRAMLLLAAIGLLATATSLGLVTYEMNKFLDAQLQEIAVNVGPGDRKDAGPLLESEDEDQLVVRIWDRSGELVHRAGPAIDIPWQPVPGLSNVTAGGQDWRIYRWSHAQHDVQIAQTWSARHEIALHAATGAALPLLLAIPLVGAVLGWSIKRTMGGLQRLSAEIGRRSVDAQEPLRPVGVPAEVAPLIVAIDKLVDRHRSALEAQRRFVADAAHELRTPLAALQIQTENLIAADLPGQTRELADELRDGVRRASYLASQLLEMARTEGASLQKRDDVDLAALATSLLADFHPLAEARNIQLAMTADAPCTIQGDRDAIGKLIGILLDNAIRYSEAGGSVELGIVDDGKTCALEIVDDGPGIPEESMPFIYDRFFRAVPQSVEGTGLGLAIAKSAADRQGFTLTHRNRNGATGIIARIGFGNTVAPTP
ncbi:cell wall metabolism sensor histidine kinase WalK [Bradyrhizobium sp. CCGB20]|uniref:sensor histidine kinase n=1 Tax=Bradyrhizobium sp. CCGB20 TaxID=2949633 RepID=UPI0020B22B52|nr:ATP-binding protein [Bradyrhizobium sp. CCGB20]MCP3397976.1 ATP-binding protein [Bradyrhizobium sp. CCGB20]